MPVERLNCVHGRILQGYLRGLFAPGEGIVTSVDVMGALIPNDAPQPGRSVEYLHFGVAIGGVIFGAIHTAAWNFDFPTPIERTLWRIASVLSTALLPVMYLGLLLS